MYAKIKKRVYQILETAAEGDFASKVFDIAILVLIIVNVILVIADTFDLPTGVKSAFYYIEVVSVILFTVEYALRIWTSDYVYKNMSPFKSRLRYIFSFMSIIDLLAILPFYLPYIFPIDLRVLRLLRVLRIFRLFKINRYTTALSSIALVFKRKAAPLLSSMFVVLLLMIIASVLMYSVEGTAQPNKFENAFSGLWWSIATLTTVGYGDIYPITTIGKILSAIIAMLGIGMVAVPTGIISAGFMECIQDDSTKDKKKYCPYCGHNLDD